MANAAVEAHLRTTLERLDETRATREVIERTIAAFTKRHELPDITFGEAGFVTLTAGDGLEIVLSLVDGLPGVLAIAEMPSEPGSRGRLARLLLQANMNWQETGGGIFAILPPDKEIHLCRQIIIGAGDDVGFERDLMRFIEDARQWREAVWAASDMLENGLDPMAEAKDAAQPRART
jgi:hypothetical protein